MTNFGITSKEEEELKIRISEFVFVGDTVVVKAQTNIKPGEEITYLRMHKGYTQASTAERRKILQASFYIDCKCKACSDYKMDISNYNSFICCVCRGTAILNEDEIESLFQPVCICLDCRSKYVMVGNLVSKAIMCAHWGQLVALGVCEDRRMSLYVLNCSKTIFSPTHPLFEVLYMELMQSYGEEGDLNNYMKYGRMRAERFKLMWTDTTPEYGIVLHEYCKDIVQILLHRVFELHPRLLGSYLKEVKEAVNKSKFAISLHHPPFNKYNKDVEKYIELLDIVNVLRIARDFQNGNN